ncbi:MAG: thioesterase family protein [Actinomycetaceae bacterium]|nr:thioesterase family protein [Actinomycetaceae bacterium]
MTTPIAVPQLTEEPLASVLRVLQLEEAGDDRFTAQSLPQLNRVYGGQVIAQALLAAAATLDGEAQRRPPHSFHAYFLRGGDPFTSFDLSVHRSHDGRSFSSRQVNAVQDGRDILTLLASFQLKQPGLEHSSVMPDVPAPETLKSAIEYFRTMSHPVGKFLGRTAAFDVRHVQESLYSRASTQRDRNQQLWMKPRAFIEAPSPTVCRALLAYVVDQVMMEPALRAHGLAWLTPGLALASLDHAMWFHRNFDINEWMLYDQESPCAQGSRAMGRVRIYSRDGTLVAEAMQEAMIRLPEKDGSSSSTWTFENASVADEVDQ